MDHLKYKHALLDGGDTPQWRNNVVLSIDQGRIAEIRHDVGDDVSEFKHIAIPGFINVHSHAFQRAMAGLTEFRTSESDSFWTWRNLMYQFLSQLSPDAIGTIARQLFIEMLRSGFTTVGEFHYVHNRPDGNHYESNTALADAVIEAAIETGINICMLPVLYQRGGFDNRGLTKSQGRFVLQIDDYLNLNRDLQRKWSQYTNVSFGMAIHSLRAVDLRSIRHAVSEIRNLNPDSPIHIHVAEQKQEVQDCIATTGKRPVEYLLDEMLDHDPLPARWCLIHATHLTQDECGRLANSQATVGLCPTTESNLGDGIFPAEDFLRSGGNFAIGSDSHISVDPLSDLRLIEYGQRLVQNRRAVLSTVEQSTGSLLCSKSWSGGAKSLDVAAGSLAVGKRADIVVLNENHPNLIGRAGDQWIDSLIFCEHQQCESGRLVNSVLVGGKKVIDRGRHQCESDSMMHYVDCLRELTIDGVQGI